MCFCPFFVLPIPTYLMQSRVHTISAGGIGPGSTLKKVANVHVVCPTVFSSTMAAPTIPIYLIGPICLWL